MRGTAFLVMYQTSGRSELLKSSSKPVSDESLKAITTSSIAHCARGVSALTVRSSHINDKRVYGPYDSKFMSDIGRHLLRSNSNDLQKLLVTRTHNKYGDRSFSATCPRLWNNLLPGLWQPGLSFDSIRQSLKSYLFGD